MASSPSGPKTSGSPSTNSNEAAIRTANGDSRKLILERRLHKIAA